MIPLYVAFATEGSPYVDELKELEKTLIQFKLPHHLEILKSQGSWEANCQLKALLIRKALQNNSGPVVYLDSDARVVDDPVIMNQIECDIAFHLFRGVELLSGTLFLGNTQRCRNLVDQWIDMNRRYPQEWDQRNLQRVVSANHDLDFLVLPESYVWIDKLATVPHPVIKHLQASRRLRKVINADS
jgi:hypothetical protein